MSEATDSVTSLAVRGHEILTGCVDGYMRRYDVRMGEMASDCLVHPITCVRFTHDGNCLLATCMDNTVRLFDKSNGELLNSYSGHKNSSYKVESAMTREHAHARTHARPRARAHTPTQTHAHTAAVEGLGGCWGGVLMMRTLLICLRGASGGDAYVACGSEDGRILFWDLVSGKLAHTLEGMCA